MNSSAQFLSPAEAAQRLGVSAKALRLYEQRGLIVPLRSSAGWRTYGPEQMNQAAEIAALRALGLSLTQVAQVVRGERESLGPALVDHQAALEGRMRGLAATVEKIRNLRADLARGKAPAEGELARLVGGEVRTGLSVSFDLPWPWGGERFEFADIRRLNYIIGPLGSGKTRLAQKIAETMPGAKFLGMDRSAGPTNERIEAALGWLVDEGATRSEALVALVGGLDDDEASVVVVDMVEHRLDHATQEAVSAWLRRRAPEVAPLFLMTRSSAILDLAAVGAEEAIILCPANHSPPMQVMPYVGAPGYEAVATCLATPEVRARTEGVIAWRPAVA